MNGIEKNINETLFLRKADECDCKLIFDWANDPSVRENSFNSKVILWDEHVKWFQNLLKDAHKYQLILMNETLPIGQIRLSIEGDCAEIGYSIAAEYRGQGYGKKMVKLAVEYIKEECPTVNRIIASVKTENVGSQKVFLNNAFHEIFRQYEITV